MAKTILVVEDSSSIRQLLSSTLTRFGYTVVEAVDGLDGLVKLEDLAVDLIITDLHMPSLDGIGLIHGVRDNAAYRFVPIIILTTENQNAIKHEAVTAGASAWVTKPFKPAEILDVIRKVMH
ncbi:MAG: response regulator [Desulfuromonadales bacterium]|nr:response regulator [Desulfuromonadales bacterium]